MSRYNSSSTTSCLTPLCLRVVIIPLKKNRSRFRQLAIALKTPGLFLTIVDGLVLLVLENTDCVGLGMPFLGQ